MNEETVKQNEEQAEQKADNPVDSAQAEKTPPDIKHNPGQKKRGAGPVLQWFLLMAIIISSVAYSWDYLLEFLSPLPWSGPYMITSAEYSGTEITKEGGRFTARFNIDVVKREGWKKIDLLPSSVAIHGAELPSGTYLHLSDNMYSVLTKQRGKLDVSITFAVAAKEADGAHSISFTRVPSITCLLKATLPTDNMDVTVAGAQSTETVRTNGQTSVVAALPDNTPITVSWKESLPKLADGPPEIHSETKTLISVAEGLIMGNARIEFGVLHKPTREFRLKVPAGVSVLNITGRNARDWRIENGLMSVQIEKEVIGSYQMEIKYETSANMDAGKLVVPVITGTGEERQKGDIGIVALTSVEIKNGSTTNAHLIDVKELPAEIAGMTSQPILLAYRYSTSDFRVALDISKHKDVGVLLTIIDRAHFTVMQTLDGKRITRAVYNVKNNRNQFLRIKLPAEAELWSASVAGRTIQPASDEEGRMLLPLIRSQGMAGMSAFPVELVYAEKGTPPDERGSGTARVDLPSSSEPIMYAMVSLYVPEQGKYDNFKGTLRKVEQFNAPTRAMPLPAKLNNDAIKNIQQAAIAQNKPVAGNGSDIDIQLPVTGKVFFMEKVLVVKDQQWFSYDFWRLTK
jgi:hypothetical protein